MKRWKPVLLAAVAVAAVAAAIIGATVARGATTSPAPAASASARPWGRLPGLDQWSNQMKDKAFRDEYFALRRSQLDDEQGWWNTYAADPQSSAAQSALSALRQQERDEMAALLKKYGVTLPSPPAGLQQLQKLAGNAAFRADAAKLGERFRSDLQAWFKTYGTNPRSSAATKAMNGLRSRYESQLKELLAKYGVKLSAGLPLGMLGHGLLSGPGRGLSVGPGVGIPGWRGAGMMDGGGPAPAPTGAASPMALPAL